MMQLMPQVSSRLLPVPGVLQGGGAVEEAAAVWTELYPSHQPHARYSWFPWNLILPLLPPSSVSSFCCFETESDNLQTVCGLTEQSLLHPGIKFIPLRTSGGELIPDSGLFVRIKKTEEGVGHQRTHRSSHLKRQDRVPMDEAGEDSGGRWAEDIDVMQSIPPSRGARVSPRRQDSAQGSRPLSSPPVLTSFEEEEEEERNGIAVSGMRPGSGFSDPPQEVDKHLQVIAEVHSEADDDGGNRAVPKEDRQEKTVVFSVKPTADEGLPTVTVDPEKEFHLTVVKDEEEATIM